MANMGKTSKAKIGLRVDLHLCRAVEKKYCRIDDDNKSVAYIRALEDATREIILNEEDYRIIIAQIRENELARKAVKR